MCKQFIMLIFICRSFLPFVYQEYPISSKYSSNDFPWHSLQVYSFQDPTAGSYGNENFTYMSQYMNWEAAQGKRDVMYYAETAYW